MAVKYRVEYTSVNDVDYTIDISDTDYSGDVINIVGTCSYGLNSGEDLSYPLRSKYLRLSLLATEEQDLDDLFATNERKWKVELYRGASRVFYGYLSSEGATQSFVSQERMIDFDVLDPMAFLEDLSYVDFDGTPFTGKERIIKIIANCLKRAFAIETQAFNIVVYCNYDHQIFNTGTLTNTEYTAGNFINDVEIPQENFYDEESEEFKSCQDVLIGILSDLHLTITQVDGNKWLIGHYLYDNTTIDEDYVRYYNREGTELVATLSGTTFGETVLKTDSTANDVDDVIHANENQSYFYKRGLKKISVDYQQEYKQELTLNSALNGGNGVTMPNWAVDLDYADPKADGTAEILRAPTAPENGSLAMLSNSETLAKGGIDRDYLMVKGSFQCTSYPNDPRLDINVKATGISSGTVYYLRFFGGPDPIFVAEATPSTNIDIPGVNGEVIDFEYKIPELPELCFVEVFVSCVNNAADVGSKVIIYKLGLYGQNELRVGTTYSSTAPADESLKTEKGTVSYNLNNASTKANQLYKFSLGNPITGIKDLFIGGPYLESLGELKGIIDLRRQKRRIIFTGDFYNFFEPSDVVSIASLSSNKFTPIEYEFDTYANIGTIKLEERYNASITVNTVATPIFTETIKPTIE